jgi:SAM-dependent methyltransferase
MGDFLEAQARLAMPLHTRAAYSEFAPFYDAVLGRDSFADARRAFEILARSHRIRFRTAADIGCGTGLFACYLSQCWGARVFGVDRSRSMLEMARRNCRDQRVCFLEQDIRCLRLPEPVDLVTANFDVVNHLVGRSDLEQMLRSVAAALRRGGHIVFDAITNCAPLGGLRVFQKHTRLPRRRIVQTIRWDPDRRLLQGTIVHFLVERPAPVVETYLERGYAPEELGTALRAAGFVTRGVHDAVTLDPVSSCTPRLRIVAHKE